MPRQEILSPGQHAQLLMLPTDVRQIAECYPFSPADLDLIAQCRGDQNRLGFAVQLGFLRHPGRAWTPAESIPETLLGYVAGQLGVTPDAFAGYASRDQTRREHLARLVATFGWRTFGLQEHREVSAWLLTRARGTDIAASRWSRRSWRNFADDASWPRPSPCSTASLRPCAIGPAARPTGP